MSKLMSRLLQVNQKLSEKQEARMKIEYLPIKQIERPIKKDDYSVYRREA